MNTGLIISREYFTRVKSKQFLITTLIVPIVLVLTLGIVAFIAASSQSEKKIAVVDQSNFFNNKIASTDNISFLYGYNNIDSLKENLEAMELDGILIIPQANYEATQKNTVHVWGKKQIGVSTQNYIQSQLNNAIQDSKLNTAGISKDQLEAIKKSTVEVSQQIGEDNKESDNKIAHFIAYACGFLLYILMVIYGMSVMKSVMEEKTNRIAEIIISSVKPFELMMGKIIGVALVGLTQFALWIILIGIVVFVGGSIMGVGAMMSNPELMAQAQAQAEAMQQTGIGGGMMNPEMIDMTKMIMNVNWAQILGWFLFYFIGGYFLYASLFAAVGSLIDDESSDSNSLTMPITMPIIIGFLIMVRALDDPNSGIAVFGSIFPLTSPIVMMARIPFNAPTWYELAASVVCMILGFLFTTWMAAKIYRTGILLNGKKISLKEVSKWIFRKG
jgi:ABC-2 type transport system permease protein